MAITIEDARGKGYKASVSKTNRLNVSAKTAPREFYVSRDNQDAYHIVSTYSATSGDEVLYFKNTSTTKRFYVSEIVASAEAGRATFSIFTASGTPTGTTVTPTNLNLASGSVADATVLGNAAVSSVTIGSPLSILSAPDDTTVREDFGNALVLGFSNAITVTFTGSAGNVNIHMRGFYEGET